MCNYVHVRKIVSSIVFYIFMHPPIIFHGREFTSLFYYPSPILSLLLSVFYYKPLSEISSFSAITFILIMCLPIMLTFTFRVPFSYHYFPSPASFSFSVFLLRSATSSSSLSFFPSFFRSFLLFPLRFNFHFYYHFYFFHLKKVHRFRTIWKNYIP